MIRFFRLSGGGNDFLALAEPPSPPSPEEVAAWCARGVSAGADGLFVLSREGDAVRMVHFNADGGRADLCVNGVRCAARLARHLGWSGEELVIRTDSGEMRGRAAGAETAAVTLPPPPPPRPISVDGGARSAWSVRIGVPHLVLEWPQSLAAAPVAELGPALRRDPALGEEGANVDFVRFPDRGHLEIRTFERGVEAETLACGSGVLAAVAVGVALDRLVLPAEVVTRGGFPFRVDGAVREGRVTAWELAGDARLVAEGILLPGASQTPRPPRWS
ncbi:MAG: diaminopimelate epimerase [Thermoanaerobaculia bacterium]|nr:diaminopimelate epimerase [Thermoanaerobaculia bacterium]